MRRSPISPFSFVEDAADLRHRLIQNNTDVPEALDRPAAVQVNYRARSFVAEAHGLNSDQATILSKEPRRPRWRSSSRQSDSTFALPNANALSGAMLSSRSERVRP